jgi:chromosome segregation ATPase
MVKQLQSALTLEQGRSGGLLRRVQALTAALAEARRPVDGEGGELPLAVQLAAARQQLSATQAQLAEAERAAAQQGGVCEGLETQLQAAQHALQLQMRLKEEAQAQLARLRQLQSQQQQQPAGGDTDVVSSPAASARRPGGAATDEAAPLPAPGTPSAAAGGSLSAGLSVTTLVARHAAQVSELQEHIEALRGQIADAQAQHDAEMDGLVAATEGELKAMQREREAEAAEFARLRAAAAAAEAARGQQEAELVEMQRSHEELVAMVSESYQTQIRALSEHAAVADNNVRRLEGELREVGGRRVHCGKCDEWSSVSEALLAQGRCTGCHRLLEHFQ